MLERAGQNFSNVIMKEAFSAKDLLIQLYFQASTYSIVLPNESGILCPTQSQYSICPRALHEEAVQWALGHFKEAETHYLEGFWSRVLGSVLEPE